MKLQFVHVFGEDSEILESFPYLDRIVQKNCVMAKSRTMHLVAPVLWIHSTGIYVVVYTCAGQRFRSSSHSCSLYGCEIQTLSSDMKRQIDAFSNVSIQNHGASLE